MSEVPPATALFRLLLVASLRLRALMDAHLADLGLTTQQAMVLTLSEGVEPPPTQGELARHLGTSHQNVRQLLDVLVRKGLVTVEVDPSDRRQRRVRCTAAVAGLFADRDAADHEAVRGWLGGLTDPEVTDTSRLLHQLLIGLPEPRARGR